ncbi:MAG TPA: ATP-binding protein [Streptosporangiaceae bacterium]
MFGTAQQHGPGCREVALPPATAAAGLARRETRAAVAGWRLGYLADTAVLLVSELVTNALQHAGPDASGTVLRLAYCGSWLRIEVHDTSPDGPQPRIPDWLDESGFGLMLVDALATKWGVQQTTQGKAVWAELDARPGGAAE